MTMKISTDFDRVELLWAELAATSEPTASLMNALFVELEPLLTNVSRRAAICAGRTSHIDDAIASGLAGGHEAVLKAVADGQVEEIFEPSLFSARWRSAQRSRP